MIKDYPPIDWDTKCQKSESFFNNRLWHSVLKNSFNVKTLYYWDDKQEEGLSICIFQKSIFKIGYIGFPLGGTITGMNINNYLLNSINNNISPKQIHLLRIPTGKFSPSTLNHNHSNSCPETYINNLENWSKDNLSKRCRRDINKSIRENSEVEIITDPSNSKIIYNLYKKTIIKNDGSMRYNEDYFKSVISLSKDYKKLRCTCIRNNNKIIAFLIMVIDKNIAHYLHGAIDYNYRKSLPNDLLIFDAIMWAKNMGAKSFNFMCSPIKQPNLIKYKEKWGGQTSRNITFEYTFSGLHSSLFYIASSLINKK